MRGATRTRTRACSAGAPSPTTLIVQGLQSFAVTRSKGQREHLQVRCARDSGGRGPARARVAHARRPLDAMSQ